MGDTAEEDDGAHAESVSFSQLLLSDDVVFTTDSSKHRDDSDGDVAGEDALGFRFSGGDGSGPRMLCFGGEYQNDAELLFTDSPVPSTCNIKNGDKINDDPTMDKSTKSNKKRTEPNMGCDRKPVKKSKRDQNKSSLGKAKVRKEKLGEKIATLQQLVSPYGKTDTASVLHEAMGYIKFLQDQVQVLCSPYLIPHSHNDGDIVGDQKSKKKDLRSRGLCLVPVSCTVHVANSNGADFWSPVTCHNSLSASMNQ
ncbi:PREDICTED: transcription factor bHLH113 isoform X2 [Tarenaya hassleriana]|uniref:transcription factor bHLH113 isoform X2 n=1 Tax=Tarenaya hassleriana TaxID=28532 RepID=UPI00053C860A|nr:PREDICTED: transcription factor bHLH113 isoform X2 [Tarenaya hassleriana]